MTDLEADVPEQIQHRLDGFFYLRWDASGRSWKQEKQINVRAWIEQAASKSTDGDESKCRGLDATFLDGGFIGMREQDVEKLRACACDVESTCALAMSFTDQLFFFFEKLLEQGDALGG